MTNKQILVLNKIVDIAKGIDGIAFAGLYPDALGSVGQKFPAVIVRDGNESAPNYDAGGRVRYEYLVDVILMQEVNKFNTRIESLLDTQNKIVTAIISDLKIAGTVLAVIGHAIDKGTDQDTLLEYSGGYQGELSSRVITFTIQMLDSRS